MADNTVLGMPLSIDLGDEGYSVSPVSAVVVMKGIDSDGDEVHIVTMTKDMQLMDALALVKYAELYCDFEIRKSFYAST